MSERDEYVSHFIKDVLGFFFFPVWRQFRSRLFQWEGIVRERKKMFSSQYTMLTLVEEDRVWLVLRACTGH